MEKRVVVIGVGNELRRDDGVGVVVARRLRAHPLPASVEVLEGHTGGLNLLFDLEGAAWGIIIDAVDFGRAPGHVEVFEAEDADFVLAGRIASLHHVSLADVLELARATGLSCRITVVGIQPAETLPGEGLSEAVAARVDEVVEMVKGLLQQAEPLGPPPDPA
jgi:hydrogenase maturation protease